MIDCDLDNTWADFADTDDIANQFTWLNTTLSQSRTNQEKVYIIGHIFPGVPDDSINLQMFSWCDNYLSAVYSTYSDIILNSFFAHEHADSFRVIVNENQPIGTMFVCPAMSTFQNFNPSVRIYEYDSNGSKAVTNYYQVIHLYNIVLLTTYLCSSIIHLLSPNIQYYANLTEANESGNIQFTMGYNPIGMYNMKDLSPASYFRLYQSMFPTNSPNWTNFLKYFNNQVTSILCSQII